MSHTSTISSIVISDICALKSAVKELKTMGINCELLENAIPRAYSMDQTGMGKAPFVIKLHDAQYDVGLYQNKDSTGMEARTDFYMDSVENQLGVKDSSVSKNQSRMGKLYQMYSIHAATRKAIQQGYRVIRHNKNDGTIQLQISA